MALLDSGAVPVTIATGPTVDVAGSLAPITSIYDTAGDVLAATGVLDGKPRVPPGGVLAGATQTGLDRVTWQPPAGVRSAIVVLPSTGGIVLAGTARTIPKASPRRRQAPPMGCASIG